MGRMPETTALPQYNLFAQLKGIQDLLCISITGMLLQRFRVVIQLHMIASGQFLPRLYRIARAPMRWSMIFSRMLFGIST